MTIRSGGRPRDPRSQQARPYVDDAYATEAVPERYEPVRRQRDGGFRHSRRGGGLAGLLRFVIFAVVLGALVLVISLTALRPLIDSAILGWAADSPGALRFPFVAEMVREDLGEDLERPASADDAQVEFLVTEGDTASSIGARLEEEGLLRDRRAFVFIATERELTGDLQSGDFILRRNMTPDEIVTALLAPQTIPFVAIELRTGLRLEQVTAKLLTIEELQMDVREFYELVTEPPRALLDDYPAIQEVLDDAPEGATLEGFLWPAGYRVRPDTTPDELVRLMLDGFLENVGEARLAVPEERGLTAYEVLTLASIVEREAVLDEERPLIAGVYQNRIDKAEGVETGLLNADPTVIWAADTVNLAELDLERWVEYAFWTVPDVPLAELELPEELIGYNSYTQPGLPPGPIATPTLTSIDGALEPDTEEGYIYFLAVPGDAGQHVFAKTKDEHDRNREEYGYD